MLGKVDVRTGNIRGVPVQWAEVSIEGHIVEQVLWYEVADAEREYGRSFDEAMDRHLQMGMFATDRIATDGTMHRVASAVSYVLEGRCTRTAKIDHCRDVEPMSAGWVITRTDGTRVDPTPWSCVRGSPPMSHAGLLGRRE